MNNKITDLKIYEAKGLKKAILIRKKVNEECKVAFGQLDIKEIKEKDLFNKANTATAVLSGVCGSLLTAIPDKTATYIGVSGLVVSSIWAYLAGYKAFVSKEAIKNHIILKEHKQEKKEFKKQLTEHYNIMYR